MKRMVYRIALTAAALLAAMGCSNNATGPSGGGGAAGGDLSGTWALTETVTGTVSVATAADSAAMYLVVDGSAVTMYEYHPGAPGTSPVVRTGTYTAPWFIFASVTYAVQAGSGTFILQDAADSSRTYGFSAFTGTVPPAFWPAPDAEDDTYEPGDGDISGATVLTAGVTQVHTTDNGDQDWFRVSLRPGYVHTVTVTGTTAASGLRVFDADSNRVFGWGDDGVVIDEAAGTVTFTPVAQSTFYIRLRGDDAAVYTIVLISTVIPASPYSGTWYLAADTLVSGQEGAVMAETSAYSENTTVEIVEFSGSLLLQHQFSVEGTWTDTMVFIYVDANTAVVNGDTVGIWQSGGSMRVSMDMGNDNYVWTKSSLYLPYYGAVPPAHWAAVPVGIPR